MIHFVGAGPGAADLITMRGAELLKKADSIIFAGSLCSLPAIIVQLTGSSNTVLHHISCLLSPTYWFNISNASASCGVYLWVCRY